MHWLIKIETHTVPFYQDFVGMCLLRCNCCILLPDERVKHRQSCCDGLCEDISQIHDLVSVALQIVASIHGKEQNRRAHEIDMVSQ